MELNQYLEVFLEESREHLQNCNEQLLELEKNPQDLSIINEIFRSAHTLKGMSATMGYEDLASLTHQMENVLDAIRNNRLLTTPEILDVIFMAVDHLEEMVESIAAGGDGKKNVSDTVEKLKLIEKGEPLSRSADLEVAAAATLEASPKSSSNYDEFELTVLKQSKEQGFGVYEIQIGLREDCLLKAARVYMVFEVLEKIGEVIKANPSVEQLEEEQFDDEFSVTIITRENPEDVKGKIMKVSEVVKTDVMPIDFNTANPELTIEIPEKTAVTDTEKAPAAESSSANAISEAAPVQDGKSSIKQQTNSKTIRVNIERLDILMNLFEELVIDRGRLEQISKELENGELTETVERMSRISGDLQNIILNMRMVQVETVFNRFPRMIRQLARDLNKKINLEIVGAETELDRTVIDEIGDPLVHLLRNSVDHGIESPEARRAKGKNEEGTVVLRAFHSGNHVFIEIEDDGAGINKDKVLQKAISKGIITEQSAAGFTDKQAFELILSSGFSTAETISDISGRGVGLDVVKNTIESLGGSISIDSKENQGTIFSIQLPLTLSIISVMLVEIQKEKFAIPLSSIIETAIIKDSEIMNAHNQKVIDFRGKVVPLLFLKDIFEVPYEGDEDQFHSVIIVRKGDKMAGLIVDSFIGQQEVVLKSLGNYLTNVFAISGATILGDGQVALIVDCNALIK
ncbi:MULTISPECIES: chemotaxis protein CheA [unclassified Mesobacillus]|jgi:two-component system, chemotaxis family, sensor kinase CheA|uniref:chemotaxis protein CheA n=1 Tax=unclassified Mesobacillus TaxID=2675270 RepID=UPI00203CDA05|nr:MULTISPECIES: chemotaxis protein CheA [unclassified Mesobacillus]MCM3123291.1 chemotaxis protein CheA [Mesobacillus sp. MER 33]MCM3233226.1 chemotaxis protein CheA [Mesobacillus sp. MER 48]